MFKKFFAVLFLATLTVTCTASVANCDFTSYITIQDGYFWDSATADYWLPRGMAYQTWNKPLGAWQTTEQIDYDLSEMKKAGINSVRIDVVWKEIEAAGDNQFDWTNYDYFFDKAESLDIRVFALIGYQWPPDWFPGTPGEDGGDPGWYTMHPPGYDWDDVYHPVRWTSDIMSFEDPNARAQYTEFLTAVATRYREHKAIVGWIVGNEYGYLGLWSSRQDGYDPECEQAFRDWLSVYYNGDIGALNAIWGTSYASFAEVTMPETYDRDDPAWADLIQWREDSVADLVALGTQAVRTADPNHLISYATVGMQWGEEDWRYHAEDTGKVAQACRDIGAPLDFWSINNYPWGLLGHESQTGQWGVYNAKCKTGIPVICTETGFTSSETMYPGLNEQNQGPLIRNSLWEELETGTIGVHIFHWNDRQYITDREKGFGIIYPDRQIKPAFWHVRDTYNLMDQVDMVHLIANSQDPEPDIVFYWSDATDQMYNRYECNMQQIWGPLERLGFEPGFINHDELITSTYYKNIWQSSPVLNLSTIYAGNRSLKITADSGGGTVAVYPANAQQLVDLSTATTFSLWVYDTQGSNTVQLRLKDEDGDGDGDGNYLWSSNASVQNQWTLITWDLTQYPFVPNLDKDRIASVELYEWNEGTYYFDETTYQTAIANNYQNFEKNNGTPTDFSCYKAIVLPRNMRAYPGDLNHIRTQVIPAGVAIYADADLPGMQDYHIQPLNDFVSEVNQIFGIDATDTSGYDDPVENEQYGIDWATINVTVQQDLAPLTQSQVDTFRVWKYSNMTLPTTGIVYATHENSKPALVIKDHSSAKAAIATFSLGDIKPDSDGDNEADIGTWAQHYDWYKAIFISGLGLTPQIDVSGSQYVLVDYRTASDGSILISAKNYLPDTNQTVTLNTSLIQGKTVVNLTNGGVVEEDSDGIIDITLTGNGHKLFRAFTGSPYKEAIFVDAPSTVHPLGDKSYKVKVRYDTLGVEADLKVAFMEDGDNGDGVPNEIYSEVSIGVSGQGEQEIWIHIPDYNQADSDYISTPDGGKYIFKTTLEESEIPVASSTHTTQLLWGSRLIDPPTTLVKGQSYDISLEWESLYEYKYWQNTPIEREHAFPGRVLVYKSTKTEAQFPGHYNKVDEVVAWLQSLGYEEGQIGISKDEEGNWILEPIKGYYFLTDTDLGDNEQPLNLDWGYLKEFFKVVILPSVYVMNNAECNNLIRYTQEGDYTILATDGAVGIKKEDGSDGTGRLEDLFGVGTTYQDMSNLTELVIDDNSHYITHDYDVGDIITPNASSAAKAWISVTTGSSSAIVKNASLSAPALIAKTITKGNLLYQDLEADNGTTGDYFADIWQSNPVFETNIVHGGLRSLKITAGAGGGTVAIYPASATGLTDLSTATTFNLWVYDTQGSNTVQLRLKDEDGDGDENYLWSQNASAQDQWTLITWDLTQYPLVPNLDKDRIASVEVYEWNAGIYYFDDLKFATIDYGEERAKTFVFNFGIDTYNQLTNNFQLIAQRNFEWDNYEIYKMKVQVKYPTEDPEDGDLVLAEKEYWIIEGSGQDVVSVTIPQTTMTGDNIYWSAYAYPWDSSDPWTDHKGFYSSKNDPGFDVAIGGYGLMVTGATSLSTGGRTFDEWIAYNTREDTLKLNFAFKESGDNGDGLSNEIYGGSPMFDGKNDPNLWLTETVHSWISNANAAGQRPQLFTTFKDIADATTPQVTLEFQFEGVWNQLTIDKSSDRTDWANIYTSNTGEGDYNPTVDLDTTCKYYRITLTDGDETSDIITLDKKMSLTDYPSAAEFRLEDWLQTVSINGIDDDAYYYPLVPDYNPDDSDLQNSASGANYDWVVWYTETDDIYEIPTSLSWTPRLKIEDPNFPIEFNPDTTVYVPVVWENLDDIVDITTWKPYAITFPVTLRIFLQDVYAGTTYATADYLIYDGDGDTTFAVDIPADTPFGSNYMWAAYIFDHKREGVEPYEERVGLDDTFRFTATGEPYEPETIITVGMAETFYSDAGIPNGSNIYVWGYGSWDADYLGETPPEGEKCFETVSTAWAGWGIFYSTAQDFSDYSDGYLRFWVKSEVTLKVEIEDFVGGKSTKYISSSGGEWQEYNLPLNEFTGVDFTQIKSPFMITTSSTTTFYVDFVRWAQ